MTRTESSGEGGVISAWAEQCRVAGGNAAACAGPDAFYLLSALRDALRRGHATPELGRAARKWGAGFDAPVEALVSLSALREVLVESAGQPDEGWRATWLPVAAEQFNQVVDQLQRESVDAASSNLRAAARTDALTGCANRLALGEELGRSVSAAERSDLDLAVAMVDLNGLKQINDSEGHDAGDAALLSLVANLRSELREADTLYRFGGDEFVVVAPFTSAAGAEAMLRRAEQHEGPRFSWGVASASLLGAVVAERPELLVTAADQDLYGRRQATREPQATGSAARTGSAGIGGTIVALSAAARRRGRGIALAAAALVLVAGTALSIDAAFTHSPAPGPITAERQAGPSGTGVASGLHAVTSPHQHRRIGSFPGTASHTGSAGHSGGNSNSHGKGSSGTPGGSGAPASHGRTATSPGTNRTGSSGRRTGGGTTGTASLTSHTTSGSHPGGPSSGHTTTRTSGTGASTGTATTGTTPTTTTPASSGGSPGGHPGPVKVGAPHSSHHAVKKAHGKSTHHAKKAHHASHGQARSHKARGRRSHNRQAAAHRRARLSRRIERLQRLAHRAAHHTHRPGRSAVGATLARAARRHRPWWALGLAPSTI